MAKISFGPQALAKLKEGKTAQEVLQELISSDPKSAIRQLAIVDSQGRVAIHTGADCMDWAGHKAGDHYSVEGNILTGPEVINDMAAAYEAARKTSGSELADWIVAALQAGEKAGGDRRGKQSGGLLVVRANGGPGGDNDRYIDLRVDDHPEPLQELGRLLGLHNQFHPQLHARPASQSRPPEK
jgi:uncharacterized Ntn-hydrolase superfamily protein